MQPLPFFNKKLSLYLLEVCRLTSYQYDNNGEFPIPNGFRLVKSFTAMSIQKKEWFGFIIESSNSVIIAFRGTRSDPDWVADAEVYQNPYPYLEQSGEVHHGFLSIYSSCRDEIFKAYHTIPKHKTLYITGHSLGAALATLHALDVTANTPFKQTIMYNYGSPRVGGPAFAKTYHQYVPHSIRFVNIHDLIPKVPPVLIYCPFTEEKWRYKHVKTPVNFSVQTGSIKGNHSLITYRKGIKDLP